MVPDKKQEAFRACMRHTCVQQRYSLGRGPYGRLTPHNGYLDNQVTITPAWVCFQNRYLNSAQTSFAAPSLLLTLHCTSFTSESKRKPCLFLEIREAASFVQRFASSVGADASSQVQRPPRPTYPKKAYSMCCSTLFLLIQQRLSFICFIGCPLQF